MTGKMRQAKKNTKKFIKRVIGPGILTLALIIALTTAGYAPASAAGERMLVPVGRVAGVRLMADGVLIIRFTDEQGPAVSAGLRQGDIIKSIGGTEIHSSSDLQKALQSCGGAPVEVVCERGGQPYSCRLMPEQTEDGLYRIGAWVRDGLAGLGTITYYDPQSGEYGALGHGINDTDTGILLPAVDGQLTPAVLTGVQKGQKGKPGELEGDPVAGELIGSLTANTDSGIFGKVIRPEWFDDHEAVETAGWDEIVDGKATVISDVGTEGPVEYEVEISRIRADGLKNMTVSITDPRLTNATGGIVQGMSGSPILQNGRIIGALTHVLIDDPASGYGIFIENMLKAA